MLFVERCRVSSMRKISGVNLPTESVMVYLHVCYYLLRACLHTSPTILTHSHSRVPLEVSSATFILLEITWE